MAERLRTGLQIREARFDSGSGLHTFPKQSQISKACGLGKVDWPPRTFARAMRHLSLNYAARILARNFASSIFN